MRAQLGQTLLILAVSITAGTTAHAKSPTAKPCSYSEPETFAHGQPFLLNDPRSGLMLYVESDGRHMSAIARNGKIVWHRNLFSDPHLEVMFPPQPQIEGQPVISDDAWRLRMHSYVGHLFIDRIKTEPDCIIPLLDHGRNQHVRGHYIRAGSGTHIYWLLDAKTGDFQLDAIN